MKHIYEGKTKSVYQLDDGTIELRFKDDVTCSDGKFDPGANSTGIKIDGVGVAGLKMSVYFFKILQKNGILTHFLDADINKGYMHVLPVKTFGKGLEVICRRKATGSFIKRYGDYCLDGQNLNYFVETTLKDDSRGDPLINSEGLETLGIMTQKQYNQLSDSTKRIAKIIADELSLKGCDLWDIKLEFGLYKDGNVILIDEISGGNMRVYKNGQILQPMELAQIVNR